MTVRHHLGLLRDQGLVTSDTERHGRGRPRNIYRLSPAGLTALRQGGCEQLAGKLLDWVLAQEDRSAERFFAAAAREAIAAHHDAEPADDLPRRLDRTVSLLAQEGFDAEWGCDAQGFIIRHRGCPYASLGQTHPAICCLDLTLVEALHPGAVSRESWRPAGDSSCTYRISAVPTSPAPATEVR